MDAYYNKIYVNMVNIKNNYSLLNVGDNNNDIYVPVVWYRVRVRSMI